MKTRSDSTGGYWVLFILVALLSAPLAVGYAMKPASETMLQASIAAH